MEPQRQWSDLGILRTTSALLGLFSLVTLWATQLQAGQRLLPECVRWYPKHAATFSDALVRLELRTSPISAASDSTKSRRNSQRTYSTACCSSPADRPDVQSQA